MILTIPFMALAMAGGAPVGITLGETHAKSCFDAAEAGFTGMDDLTTCERALAVQPLSAHDKASTLVNRGIIHMNRGDHAAAERDFADALRLDGKQAEAHLNTAILALRRDDAARARSFASRAIDLGTRKPHIAYYVRGIANEEQGAVGNAYRDLKMAQSLAPRWAVPAAELARYRVRER